MYRFISGCLQYFLDTGKDESQHEDAPRSEPAAAQLPRKRREGAGQRTDDQRGSGRPRRQLCRLQPLEKIVDNTTSPASSGRPRRQRCRIQRLEKIVDNAGSPASSFDDDDDDDDDGGCSRSSTREVSSTTPLHHSARQGDAAMVRHLLEQGCNPNAVDSSGFSPLQLAVRDADAATVAALVNNGATVIHRKMVRAALERAVKSSLSTEREKSECRAILETLLDNATTESQLGSDPVKFAAVAFGKIELARLVLAGDYPIDCREPARGYTALHFAFLYGKLENARALRAHGADDRVLDRMGFSPFHYYPGNLELVDDQSSVLQHFLMFRAELYVPDGRGVAGVECLLRCGNEETRKAVLAIGFAIVVAAYEPRLVRHRLEEEVVRKMMELLLQHGFDAQRFDSPGVPFIGTLRERDHKSVLRVFIAHLALIGRLSDSTREAIAAEPFFKEQFDASTKVVETMKARVIHGRVSLFKVLLTDDERKLAAYVRNEKSSREVLDTALNQLPASEEYYRAFLRKRIEDAFRRAKFEEKIVATVQMLTGLDADLYHVIIYMIIGYLDISDLNNLCRVGGM